MDVYDLDTSTKNGHSDTRLHRLGTAQPARAGKYVTFLISQSTFHVDSYSAYSLICLLLHSYCIRLL